MRLLSCNQLAGGQNKHGERDGESELPALVIKKAFQGLLKFQPFILCFIFSIESDVTYIGRLSLTVHGSSSMYIQNIISKICIRFPLENPRFSIWL